jgi:hypothetical protein
MLYLFLIINIFQNKYVIYETFHLKQKYLNCLDDIIIYLYTHIFYFHNFYPIFLWVINYNLILFYFQFIKCDLI